MRERAVIISSTMPSAKYSCSGSPLMFWNGKTAIDGLSGSGSPLSDPPFPGLDPGIAAEGRVGAKGATTR
jgi:hypothetical protein